MVRRCALIMTLLIAGCVAPTPAPVPRFPVFFTEWSAKLDDPATSTIAQAAAAANKSPTLPVTVLGFADPTGSAQANHDISSLRAQLVEDQLVTDGVARERIHRVARGATAFTESSQESRRVEVIIGTP
jgi:outer membrane protein OmpA-like peptidoglycan-associated protein